eukprot:6199557-Pleurochrysis_carterae.AAC.3
MVFLHVLNAAPDCPANAVHSRSPFASTSAVFQKFTQPAVVIASFFETCCCGPCSRLRVISVKKHWRI